MVLMIIADPQGGLWNLEFRGSGGIHEDGVTGRKKLGKTGIGAGDVRRLDLPALAQGIVKPPRDVRARVRQGQALQTRAGLE